MVVLAFDTLAYAKKLEQAGMPAEQAEVQAEALKSVVDGQAVALATKENIDQATFILGSELKAEIQEARTELKTEIQEVRTELKTEIQGVRADMKVMGTRLSGEIRNLDTRLRVMERIGWAVTLGVLALLVKAFLFPLIGA